MSAFSIALAVLPFAEPPPAPWQPPITTISHDVGRDLAERDAFGSFPNLRVSDRHVIKWGDAVELDEDGVTAIAEALETSWTLFVDERGMAPPVGSDEWLLNVYVGNTGAPAPSIGDGLLGYFSKDDDGAPLIVLQPDLFSQWNPGVDTATHELFHALQHTEYGSAPPSWRWFSEATATWSQEEVWSPSTASHRVPAYGTTPWLSIEHVDRDSTDWFIASRHYGAFLFPRFLTERLNDHHLVQDALLRPGSALDALDAVVEERGEDMARLFGEFAAANATWDYERGPAYRAAANEPWSPESEFMVARAGSLGRTGWREPPVARRPSPWSWDLVRVDAPIDGVLQARFRSLAPCDVQAWVHVVSEGPAGVEVSPVVDGTREGSLDVPVGGEEHVFLAMAFTGPTDGAFSYQYAMQVNGEALGAPPEPEWPGVLPTCAEPQAESLTLEGWEQACSVGGSSPSLLLLLVFSGAVGSRRRRSRSRPEPRAARSPDRSGR
jgi:hypothetical protein